jgi:hypothetical protein
MYDTDVKQDDRHKKEIEPFKIYLSLALSAFESIRSCKYAPCEFCKHRNEDDTPFCGAGHKWEWEYAEDVKRLLRE